MQIHKLAAIITAFLVAHAPALAAPEFTRIDTPAHQYLGGWEHYVGGGLASFDCDGDRFPELFAAGGTATATLLRNVTEQTGAPVKFVSDTPDNLALTSVTGAYPLDIDSDGITDLAILRVGKNMLLRGTGDCNFEPFSELGFISDSSTWTTAFSATWEAGRSLPSLAFGNYVDREDPDGPFEACDGNELYRPEGGKYTASPLNPGYCTLSMLFSDWARNGKADLRVSNDRHYYVRGGAEQLWEMGESPRLYTEEDGWKPYHIWGMGIASRDLTGDGYAEVYLTSMGDQKLQTPTGNGLPQFDDYTYERGTTAHRPFTGGDGRPSTGWHVAFGDVENNGRDDIFVAKGNVERMAGAAMKDPNNLLLQGTDGNFSEAGDVAGIATLARSRGAALVDFNRDGLLDLAVTNRKADIEVYQNTTSETGHWLSLKPQQSDINPDAIGGFVEVRNGTTTMTREITIGGGHAGGSLGPQHFGLGDIALVEARVIWPDGSVGEWHDISADSAYILHRSEGLLAD
jgi:hypothetical protein